MNFLIIFLISLSYILTVVNCNRSCPEERNVEVDNCVAKVLVINCHSSPIPTNLTQMETHCSEIKRNNRCLKNFSVQCLPPFSRQITFFLYRAINVYYNRVCSSIDNKKEYMSHASCMISHIDKLSKLLDEYINNLNEVTLMPSKHKIPLTCCISISYYDLIEKELNKICSPESTKFLMSLVKNHSQEFFESVCVQYMNTPSKCNSLPSFPSNQTIKTQYLTPYFIFLKVFTQL